VLERLELGEVDSVVWQLVEWFELIVLQEALLDERLEGDEQRVAGEG
jgi:hypothetical protein